MTTFIIAASEAQARRELGLKGREHMAQPGEPGTVLLTAPRDLSPAKRISVHDVVIFVMGGPSRKAYEALVRQGKLQGVNVTELRQVRLW